MPRFRSLSEMVRYQIRQINFQVEVPTASSLGVQMGQGLVTDAALEQPDDSFRWGYSTWGVEDITTDYAPADEP